MILNLDPATEQRIQREIDLGHYTEPAQVIEHAVALLDGQSEWLEQNKDAINQRLEESYAEAQRGELYTAEEAYRLLDERAAARAVRQITNRVA